MTASSTLLSFTGMADYLTEPMVQFVDQMINHALQQNASDIHIEPYAHACRIRYRRDGILSEVSTVPTELTPCMVSRLKVMGKLDIAERRLPQDGRFQINNIDIRINTCPTLFGEKIVLRLLDTHKSPLHFSDIGMDEQQKNIFIKKISGPHGMVLVTGPTGSGKTVTLYAALNYLNSVEKNIATIEDPIEIQLHGINQISVQPNIGLDYPILLRTLLRQDPDIMMVGEIRDQITAEMAIQAAHTGHLVLSTLHTNNALEAMTRLTALGIAHYKIITTVSLIVAQRLVRLLCPLCKQEETLPASLHPGGPEQTIFRATGCQECSNGYRGRTGIYEFLSLTPSLTELILSGKNPLRLQAALKKEAFATLHARAMEKVVSGVTSLSEINRVLLSN